MRREILRPSKPTVTLLRPLALLAIGVLAVLSLVTTAAVVYWFFYVTAALVGLTWFWVARSVANLRLSRTLSTKAAFAGDDVAEEFRLTNLGRLPVLMVELEDESDFPGYSASIAENLDSHQTKVWASSGRALRRGVFTMGPMIVRTGDPFGIFSAQFDFPRTTTFVVYPKISIMPDLNVPAGHQFGSARSSSRTQQITSDAAGIRDFAPGDPMKRIHWLSTARRGQITVKEFDLEPAASVWIALDLQRSVQAGRGADTTEEMAVKVATAVAYQQIRAGRAVGLAAHGGQRIRLEPQKGAQQLWRILEHLAILSAQGTQPFETSLAELTQGLGSGVSVVGISPAANTGWMAALAKLARRRINCTAVHIDAASFGGQASATDFLPIAAAGGVSVRSVSQGQEFASIRPDFDPQLSGGLLPAALVGR